ncbi:MAG: SEC-C metal-binding domain-containing protein, partial [Planctomycetota bacterium]
AQKKVEDRNFEIRKNLLEYDEVMDHQRTEIYAARQAVLEGEDLKSRVDIMISNLTDRNAAAYEGDAEGFIDWVQRTYGLEVPREAAEAAVSPDNPDLDPTLKVIDERYVERREAWGDELTRRIESYLVLTAIDQKWKDHLHAMDSLKAGIGLRGYGQQDPKIAYKKEATELFAQNLLPAIESDVASKAMRIEVQKPSEEDDEATDRLTPRGMASGQPAPQQRQVRFDELELDQQIAVVEQLPEEQKLMAVLQAGPNQAELLATLPEELQAKFEEIKRRAELARQQREQLQRGPAASSAFDVMRRRKQMEEQQRRASGESDAPSKPAQPAQREPARPRAAATAEMGPEFKAAGRNDPCPCGSGKKFKKCHGR